MITRFATPIAKHYWPFFVSGAVLYYGIGKTAEAYSKSDEFINDSRNPRFARGEKIVELKQ